ncbi:hypothetical protein N7474_003101 [Penicillium riverlandense]|uniref:uncharacterized protein n=1 Tax=Penicillium riverlandense TaxID=1903569 RepID=UPI0025482D4F|nr:uncharacterized protein N7474_003101 [Penicillium riverlandense]KAJ5825963.1 hypothetical protein N7474_003101 [Penicillium riverlandense]
MHLSRFGLLALGAATADAFRDTSPFFLASTSEVLANSAYIKSGASLLDTLSTSLSSCPSDYYVVVNQPGVHSSDFSTRKSAPRLGAKMLGKDKAIRSKMTVNEVAGLLEAKDVSEFLETKCKAKMTAIDGSSGSYPSSFEQGPRIISVDFPMLSLGSDRAQQLSDNVHHPLCHLPREFPESDSVVYDSGEGSYQDALHMDLKRDYSSWSSNADSSDDSGSRGLFEKYQYFTPGIFMGFMASFLCLIILYIGVSALSSLQVPYAAFEKDTSSSVQKKQQ